MSIANIGSYYSNLIEPRQVQSVLVKPNPALTVDLGSAGSVTTPSVIPMAGIFGAGSLITNVHLAGANPNCATFTVGIAGKDGNLTGNLVLISGTFGSQGLAPGTAGLGVTLAQDSWLTVTSVGTAAGTLAASNLNLLVTYMS
jgi:hypothetical protein